MTNLKEKFEYTLQWAKDIQTGLGFSLGLADAIIRDNLGQFMGCLQFFLAAHMGHTQLVLVDLVLEL